MRRIFRIICRMDYREHILTLADAYCIATNRSLARVSTIVRNDGKFFRRLREGAGCTMDTYQKCLRWFSEQWPDGLPWPDDVPRPHKEHDRWVA